MNIVKELSRLPSSVEFEGCTFILCTGRDYKKGSLFDNGISLCYQIYRVDADSKHYAMYAEYGSWDRPEYGPCNFLVLHEFIDNDDELINCIDSIERHLIRLGIDL